MKVKVLLNIGSSATGFPRLKEGEHEVSREVGVALIERGWATAISEPAAQMKAVPNEPTIKAVTAKATNDLKSYRDKTSRENEQKQPANKEQ